MNKTMKSLALFIAYALILFNCFLVFMVFKPFFGSSVAYDLFVNVLLPWDVFFLLLIAPCYYCTFKLTKEWKME